MRLIVFPSGSSIVAMRTPIVASRIAAISSPRDRSAWMCSSRSDAATLKYERPDRSPSTNTWTHPVSASRPSADWAWVYWWVSLEQSLMPSDGNGEITDRNDGEHVVDGRGAGLPVDAACYSHSKGAMPRGQDRQCAGFIARCNTAHAECIQLSTPIPSKVRSRVSPNPDSSTGAIDATERPGRRKRPAPLTLIVLCTGLAITGLLSWVTYSINVHNEDRLLQLQARQAATILAGAVPTISDPVGLGG